MDDGICAIGWRPRDRRSLHNNGLTLDRSWLHSLSKRDFLSLLLEVQNDATQNGPVGKVGPDARLFLEFAEAVVLELHAFIEQVLDLKAGNAEPLRKTIADAEIHDEEAVMSLVL